MCCEAAIQSSHYALVELTMFVILLGYPFSDGNAAGDASGPGPQYMVRLRRYCPYNEV